MSWQSTALAQRACEVSCAGHEVCVRAGCIERPPDARAWTTPREAQPERSALVLTAASFLGLTYLANIVVSMGAPLDPAPLVGEYDTMQRFGSFVPWLGPWLQLTSRASPFDHDAWGPWLVTAGALEAAGLIAIVIGVFAPPSTWTVAPAITGQSASLVVAGAL